MRHLFQLPRVYPITDIELSGLSHAVQLERLARGGATLVQLREKHLSPADFHDETIDAIAIANQLGVTIIINDRADLALATGAHGVHLGQDDMAPEAARKLLGPDAIIGYSTHSINEAVTAIKLPIDYLAIGPIFATTTKSDTASVLGLDGLRAVRDAIGNFPLVAIGGINHSNARHVIDAGADCVAVISAVVSDPQSIPDYTRSLIDSLPPPVHA
jgi:thiamine-phosphate pyrophosphorylase